MHDNSVSDLLIILKLVLLIVQNIIEEIDLVSIIYDHTWAFNTVYKMFLDIKFNVVAVRGSVNQCFVSFLENRKFGVKVDVFSGVYYIDIGTQGSFLRPLMFLIVINEF